MVYHYMNVGHIGYPCPWILPSVKTGQQLYTHAIVTQHLGTGWCVSVSQPPAEVCLTDLAWDYPGV